MLPNPHDLLPPEEIARLLRLASFYRAQGAKSTARALYARALWACTTEDALRQLGFLPSTPPTIVAENTPSDP